MSSNNNDDDNNIINIKLRDRLEQKNIVAEFYYHIPTKSIKIGLNHKYQPTINSVFKINVDDWSKNAWQINKILKPRGVEPDDIQLLEMSLDDYWQQIWESYSNNNNYNARDHETDKETDKEEKSKSDFITYKYSQMGKGDLHEAVIVNGLPFFIKYNHESKDFELLEHIEENKRILKPPERDGYPYTPYEFESNEELAFFIEKAKQVTLDELYNNSKSLSLRYVDQDDHIISLLAADSIWTYFQDLFSVTHYLEGVGDNDVGKSTIGYTFEYTAYRVIKGTAISGANYYRSLGTDEPGQCIIIEDEGDSISDDPDKIKILKSGYEYNGKVPKINMNSTNQDQRWFKTYCYKMILAEKSLSQLKAKGLLDRTFSFHCRPGKVEYSIKEIVSENINKNPRLQRLYKELLDFRRLMLCYRLVHYKDLLPEISTGLKNRDEELCKPLLQLFYGTEALKNEIINTLEVFIKQRRDRRSSSLEAAIFPIIRQLLIDSDGVNQLDQVQTKELKYSNIWTEIISGAIEGFYNDKKQNQYETVSYGIIYNNYLSRFISYKFGAQLDPKRDGSVLTFDIKKLKLFENIYGETAEKDVKIKVELQTSPQDEVEDEEGKKE